MKIKAACALSGDASSAPAEGVAALISATISEIVKSVSCPTALKIGMQESAIALAVLSSLKAQRSSSEPPPRVKTSVSHSFLRFAV